MINYVDINTIVGIMLTAHGECYICGAKLVDQFRKSFPHYKEEIELSYVSLTGNSIDTLEPE